MQNSHKRETRLRFMRLCVRTVRAHGSRGSHLPLEGETVARGDHGGEQRGDAGHGLRHFGLLGAVRARELDAAKGLTTHSGSLSQQIDTFLKSLGAA